MPDVAKEVALACRILANEGLLDGIAGHVSLRTGEDELWIRCRPDDDPGLAFTSPEHIRRVDFAGNLLDGGEGWSVPNELPLHTVVYRNRPDVTSVVHGHPPAALICGLAGLTPRPVLGSFNIPALRLAQGGIPVYPRSVIIARDELAEEMMAAMGDRPVCLLRGHGVTVAGETLHQATVRAVDLNILLSVTVSLARLDADAPEVPPEDMADLPDLGSAFNDDRTWRALEAKLEGGIKGGFPLS